MTNQPNKFEIAFTASRALHAAGVTVIASMLTGEQPVLIVNRPPAGIKGAVRRRLALADGRHELTRCAMYEGVRIEWREFVRPAPRIDLSSVEVLGNA